MSKDERIRGYFSKGVREQTSLGNSGLANQQIYYEITIKRKFVLMAYWNSTDVLQQSLGETLNQYFISLISSGTIMTIQSMYAFR